MKMKKLLTTICVVVLLFGLSACGDANSTVSIHLKAEEGEPANGFVWENNYSEITITGYVGSSNDIVIPEKINDKPVTLIASGAFSNFSGMKSLKVPGSVKKMDGAFENCTSLETVELSEGIESINSSFQGCTAIKNILLPGSVKEMDGAFQCCTSIEEINIPANIVSLEYAFAGCTALKTIVIAEGVTNLDYAFAYCPNLESVTIPNSVTVLKGTFQDCSSLKNITLPEGLESLEETFQNCTSLVNISIPESVTGVWGAFNGCTLLKTLEFPENTGISVYNSYGDFYPFSGCSSLETLVLPNSYKGKVDIEGLTSIKKITMSEESMNVSLVDEGSELFFEVRNKIVDSESVDDGHGTYHTEYIYEDTYNDVIEVNGQKITVKYNGWGR